MAFIATYAINVHIRTLYMLFQILILNISFQFFIMQTVFKFINLISSVHITSERDRYLSYFQMQRGAILYVIIYMGVEVLFYLFPQKL